MNYDQFIRDEYSRYELFANTVADVLQAAIGAQPRDFRLQQIKSRAKDPKSLKRKLTERGLLQSEAIENDLKDLAGCRLIFYTNTDVDRFLASRLIFENFAVDFDGSKIHHAVGKERSADELYFAIHYLVSLKEDRLSLAEYAKFRGMRCEVQIQTILNHAWAETSHDILYHPPSIQGLGTRQLEEIKKRLAKIMNRYLLPAGYEIQKVQHDYERLLAGKELFDHGIIDALGVAKDNNERYERLHRIRIELLPLYDDVPAVAPELIRAASDAVKEARKVATAPIETPFGNFDGHDAEHVANEALQLIDDVRYVDVAQTFHVLCDLYATSTSDEERKRVLQSMEVLARNDINAWRQVGLGVQQAIYDEMSALAGNDRSILRPLIVTLCRLFVDTELQGTTSHFDSVSLQRGAVPATTAYGRFRGEVIDTLFDLYRSAATLGQKLDVIHSFSTATRFPMDGGQVELIELVLEGTKSIVDFISERIEAEPFEIIEHLEHEFLWLYRHSKGMATSEAKSAVNEKARAVVAAIEAFRDRANSDPRFVQFKTLVGYDLVFSPDWHGDPHDISAQQAYRAARVAEYAKAISSETADEWYGIIRLCASVESNDGATFLSFGEFLKQLSQQSPAIVVGYLQKDEDLLSNFLPPILEGFAESAEPAAGFLLINEWIEKGRHLAAVARYLRFATNTQADLVAKVGERAIASKDALAAIEVLAAIVARQLDTLVDTVLLPVMRLLTEMNDARWANAVWFMPSLHPFLSRLSEAQCEVALKNLVLRQRIAHHDERILRAIAATYPRIVWQFFKARVDRKEGDGTEEGYEPIPFQLPELRKSLVQHAALAVEIVRGWYSPGDRLFTYSGGRLLQDIFPVVTSEFEAQLVKLVQSGAEGDVDFVLSILRSYRGGSSMHTICKELIAVLAETDKRIGQVEIILQSTGVVSGTFGLVEAYQRKNEEMEDWLVDPRPKVRVFAEKYRRTLDRSIAAEQRRSETDYELRKREWPEEE